MDPILAVIIVTRNRSQELERYALPSLELSGFKDFICLLWDASEDEVTHDLARSGNWTFPLEHHRARRPGIPSQRNDAVEYLLERCPSTRYILFIDDDCELLPEALEGVVRSFEDPSVWGVGIPVRSSLNDSRHPGDRACRRYLTPCMRNIWIRPDRHGDLAEWLSGCAMAFRTEVFKDLKLCFPEAFQRFGGYALAEDIALSYGLHKVEGKKLIVSLSGSLYHHVAPGGRPNLLAFSASRWYNFHLLFELINHDTNRWRLALSRIKMKVYWFNRSLRYLFRGQLHDFTTYLRGIVQGERALREHLRTQDIRFLIKKI